MQEQYGYNSIVEINGVTKQIKVWGRENNLDPKTIINRLKSGVETSNLLLPSHALKKGYKLNGKHYSLKEISAMCGVGVPTLRRRLRQMSLTEAMNKPVDTRFHPKGNQENPNLTDRQKKILAKFRSM